MFDGDDNGGGSDGGGNWGNGGVGGPGGGSGSGDDEDDSDSDEHKAGVLIIIRNSYQECSLGPYLYFSIIRKPLKKGKSINIKPSLKCFIF